MIIENLIESLPRRFTKAGREHWFQLLGGMAALFDGMADAVFNGRLAALPGMRDVPGGNGFDDATALPLTARDRQMRGGELETAFHWAQRQREWRDLWSQAASAPMLLEQLAAVLSPDPPRVWMVTGNSVWWVREPDGALANYNLRGTGITYNPATGAIGLQQEASNIWDWDSASDPIPSDAGDASRIWVFIQAPCNLPLLAANDGEAGDPGVAGDGWNAPTKVTWPGPDAGTIGTTAPWRDVETVRTLLDEWRAAGAPVTYVVINFGDAHDFAPLVSFARPSSIPDGTWGWDAHYHGGTRNRSRYEKARYWRGSPGGQGP